MNRVVSVQPLPEYRLRVVFDDGFSGIYAVAPHQRGGVFLKILEPGIFASVIVNPEFGCVEWPAGIDLCPNAMRREMAPLGQNSTATR